MAVLDAYYGVTLTLADTTAHSLLALLIAAVPAFAEVRQNCSSLRIQADLGNAGLTVRVGDASVSTTRCAYEISTHDQVPYESPSSLQVVPLGAIYVLASAATALIHVEIIFG